MNEGCKVLQSLALLTKSKQVLGLDLNKLVLMSLDILPLYLSRIGSLTAVFGIPSYNQEQSNKLHLVQSRKLTSMSFFTSQYFFESSAI